MNFTSFIQGLWQFPQNILGLIIKKVSKHTFCIGYKDATVHCWKHSRGLSLGKYIFIPYEESDLKTKAAQRCIKHEYGHTMQSKYLGVFYLLIIGLPSAIWSVCFEAYRLKTGKSYYEFYTESWADILGGVGTRES